jgi:hypothetical protein
MLFALHACSLAKLWNFFCDVNLFQYNSCLDSDLCFKQNKILLIEGKMLENLLCNLIKYNFFIIKPLI